MKRLMTLSTLFLSLSLLAQEWTPAQWPVMTHYDSDHLQEVALPLGGIGTGMHYWCFLHFGC